MASANFSTLTGSFSVEFKLDELSKQQKRQLLKKLLDESGLTQVIFATEDEKFLQQFDLTWENYFSSNT